MVGLICTTTAISQAHCHYIRNLKMNAWDQALTLLFSQNSVNVIDRHISELKARRNANLPVVRLPVEVIANIFFLLARPPRDWTQWRNDDSDIWDWLEVTKVCRRWREVALGYAALWAEIKSPIYKNKAKTFLERSGQADLSVDLGLYRMHSSDYLDVLDLIRHHMKRVRYIRIIMQRRDKDWNEVQNLFKDQLPRLKRLYLSVHPFSLSWESDPLSVRLDELASFAQATSLEVVWLNGVAFPWNSQHFTDYQV